MKQIPALLLASYSVLLASGALQQESILHPVESFLVRTTQGGKQQASSWLRALLPPADEDASATVTHELYDIASFRSIHDRRPGNGILDRFQKTATRGGSSVVDDSDDDTTSAPVLSPTSHKNPYSVSTTLIHGNGATSLAAGCDIIEAKQTTRYIALWDSNTPALWKTCAFLSDTLVVGLTERTTVSPLLTQALQAGLVARRAQKLSKPRLVFALHDDSSVSGDKTEFKDWKEQLVLHELSGISERLVDSFQVMAVHELLTQKPKSRKGGVSKVAEPDTFPRLMDQVHSSFGGSDDTLLDVVDSEEDFAEAERMPEVQVIEHAPVSSYAAIPEPESGPDPTVVFETAMEQLELLQEQQDDAAIQAQTGAMPFDFASMAAPILDLIASSISELPIEEQAVLQQQIGVHIQQLYQQQLSSLRDYYGRLYETMMDKTENEKEWKNSVNKVLEQFRKAAASAIPSNINAFGELDLQYLSSCTASGLRDDMMQAMELRQSVELESDTDDSAVGDGEQQRRKLPTWYKKLAARGLVLGINYFQGWLAWQGIKRAALQRERNLPKFPLF